MRGLSGCGLRIGPKCRRISDRLVTGHVGARNVWTALVVKYVTLRYNLNVYVGTSGGLDVGFGLCQRVYFDFVGYRNIFGIACVVSIAFDRALDDFSLAGHTNSPACG